MKSNKGIRLSLFALLLISPFSFLTSPAVGNHKAATPTQINVDTVPSASRSQNSDNRYLGDIDRTNLLNTRHLPTLQRRGKFVGRVDAHNAHISGDEVSGHVSWTLVKGEERKLIVQATLKAKTSWYGYSTKAKSEPALVWPGGGRGRAAVARYTCNGNKSTKWYTYGEGFAPGAKKPFGKHKGNVQKLACGA